VCAKKTPGNVWTTKSGALLMTILSILQVRLSELYDEVDFFVILESITTFRSAPKALHFKDNEERYSKYLNKIIHVPVNTLQGRTHWDRLAVDTYADLTI
jgi:hypothetical protein